MYQGGHVQDRLIQKLSNNSGSISVFTLPSSTYQFPHVPKLTTRVPAVTCRHNFKRKKDCFFCASLKQRDTSPSKYISLYFSESPHSEFSQLTTFAYTLLVERMSLAQRLASN